MFKNKKDEEINDLKAKVETLESRLKIEEKLRIDAGIKADREHADYLLDKKEVQQREDEFNAEIARLRRIIASEKKKRINSVCANRRRLHGRSK